MNWKLTKEAEEMMKKLANEEEIDSSPFGGGDGFWYDITSGGYFKPEEALSDTEQVKKVKEALELLESLERDVYDKLVPEF